MNKLSSKTYAIIAFSFISAVLFFVYRSGGELNNTTLIVVPGGGLTSSGELPAHVILRVDKAIELWRNCQKNEQQNCLVATLSAGTPHKPNPTDSNGFTILEATVAAKYLISHGIPPSVILEENLSLDTIGNAYFLRLLHTDPLYIRHLILVTNNWHMQRALSIFKRIFSIQDDISRIRRVNEPYVIDSVPVESGFTPELFVRREAREQESLRTFLQGPFKHIDTLYKVHHFIFQQHKAYSTNRHVQDDEGKRGKGQMDNVILSTY